MAQSQVSIPSLARTAGAGHWENAGPVREQPIDTWSRLPEAPVTESPAAGPVNALGPAIGQVLSAWRAAERSLDEHVEASPMRSLIEAKIARLRAEYQRLFAQAIR